MIYNEFYPTKIAITGSNGRLGSELLKLKWDGLEVIGWTRRDADLSKEKEVETLVSRDLPDIIIHTAAATDLTKCENDKLFAWNNITIGTVNIVKYCNENHIKLVHISTDYIFGGDEPVKPIPTWMRPNPLNYYSICKVASETAVMTTNNYAIIRLSVKNREPWKHDKAPTDMFQTICYYDEAAQFIQKVIMNEERGILHYGTKDVNVF